MAIEACPDCNGTGAENGVTGKGACSGCGGTGRLWQSLSSDAHVLPDRIAIDANGYGWRVWNDSDMWSMVPTNANNDPVPEPVTWFVPEAQLERIAKALGVGEVFITGDRKAELLDTIVANAEFLLHMYETNWPKSNPKNAPITVNVENLPAVELCMKRLAELGEFLDRLHDEAFPDDPYLLGRLHAEMERLGYGSLRGDG